MNHRHVGWAVLVGLAISSLPGCSNEAPDKDGPPAAGCTKDTDCKGDRLCVAGQCQDAPAASPGAPAKTSALGPAAPSPAPAPATPPANASGFREVPEAEWKPIIGPRLRRGAIVAHAVFEGPIGPTDKGMFVVTREGAEFFATVWADGRGYRSLALANNGATASRIPAVSFFDADGDGKTDALVMATYTPPGGGKDGFENALLRWNGTALVRLHNLEPGIASLESVAAIRAKLKR